MESPPPVVIEYVLPSDFEAGWRIPGLHFRGEEGSFGVDYDSGPGVLIGAQYGDTARIVTGPVHDNRWTVKIAVRF